MSKHLRAMLVLLCAFLPCALAACGGGEQEVVSGAAVSTSTAATSAFAEILTPLKPPLPTASSGSDTMGFGGTVWVNGRPAYGELLAYIDRQICGRGQSNRINARQQLPKYVLAVSSDADQPGCGVPGSPITITLNGDPLNDVVLWEPGFQADKRLVAGPPFATYFGVISVGPRDVSSVKVTPYVGDLACGEQLSGAFDRGEIAYFVVVYSDELHSGCGAPGSVITFRAEVEGLGIVDLGTESWTTADTVTRETVDVSGAALSAPPTSIGE